MKCNVFYITPKIKVASLFLPLPSVIMVEIRCNDNLDSEILLDWFCEVLLKTNVSLFPIRFTWIEN